jgi:tetratricopeptide (TPR) repeat protein
VKYIILLLILFYQCASPNVEVKDTTDNKVTIDSSKEIAKDSNPSSKFLNPSYAEEKSIKKLSDPKEINKAKSLLKEGLTLYKIKKNQEALSKFEESLEIAADTETYYRYGDALSNTDRLEEAIKAYDISLALGHPKEHLVIYNKACIYSKQKKENDAYETIFLAIDKGYGQKGVEHMSIDPDLEYLRSLPDWKSKYKEIKKRLKQKEELEKSKG